jgi:aminoglycoside phosphotransferase (APT) family kinase protein
MHDDEIDTDVSLVRRLLAAQFPAWADLPLDPFESAGTDNAIYRLGGDMAVRLPLHSALERVEKEQRWLPVLAPHLPLAVPLPLAKGKPGAGYPWAWSIYRWLEGENATIERISDPPHAAVELAGFLTALQEIDSRGGPSPGPHNAFRGAPLASRDAETRAAIIALDGLIDGDTALAAWEAALQAPPWSRPPVWIHGDLQSGNLLAQGGRISAAIDFGCLGVGDPACDLQVAWNLFAPETRSLFRAHLKVDDAAWARGRGWALSVGLIALPYYQRSNPVLAGISRHAIQEVLADHKQGRGVF